ncbi:MAG: polyhydroxyalkanoate depolymerase, partial [Pseudomonadota bacterium]|nr:polyhydroxyalkanoate depolymerase [Pseudomonadota bacterium]
MMIRENSPLYHLHEMHYAAISPLNFLANASKAFHRHPLVPIAYTGFGRSIAAAAEVIERVTHRYGKPDFGILHTAMDGKQVTIYEETVMEKPFCRLVHFEKYGKIKQPKLLLVAPMSGHHSTLLRGTVEALLPFLDVYITDWIDARNVPMYEGEFRLEDYIAYVIEFTRK